MQLAPLAFESSESELIQPGTGVEAWNFLVGFGNPSISFADNAIPQTRML